MTKVFSEPNLMDFAISQFEPMMIGPAIGGIYLGNKISEAGGAMTPKFPESATAAPAAPAPDDTSAKEAALAEADRLRKRKGVRSTTLTGPSGVLTPATTLKTILG